MTPLTTTVNMNHRELTAWLNDSRHLLASTNTGLESLRRLVAGDHYHDDAFARKVDNFNERHGTQSRLFGKEVMKSGWSKRHIALKNWGHDPSKNDSPLYDSDQVWLSSNPNAKSHRRGRVPNPMVITEIQAPDNRVSELRELGKMLGGPMQSKVARNASNMMTHPTGCTLVLVPESDRVEGAETEVPFGSCVVKIGLLQDYVKPSTAAHQYAQNTLTQSLYAAPYDDDTEAFRQVLPAMQYNLACAYMRDRVRTDGREPNPPISAWIMPLAQFLVSVSGLVYSITDLIGVFGGDKAKNTHQTALYNQ